MGTENKQRIDNNTIIQSCPNILFSEVDNEVVILSFSKGEYYQLDEIGSDIWKMIKRPCKFIDLITLLMKKYEINEQTCTNDTKAYLEDLLSKKLVILNND
jgi:hypothetical protein